MTDESELRWLEAKRESILNTMLGYFYPDQTIDSNAYDKIDMQMMREKLAEIDRDIVNVRGRISATF